MDRSNKPDPGPFMSLILKAAKEKSAQSSSPVESTEPESEQSSKPVEPKEPNKDLNWYLPLYKAVLQGDWESAKKFFDQDPDAVTAKITKVSETALHIAVGAGRAIHFVEELLELIPIEALVDLRDQVGQTVLHYAAIFGNVKAAEILVGKNKELTNVHSDTSSRPVHLAALYANKDMVSYLLTITKDDANPNPFADKSGVDLLNLVTLAEFYDLALYLVQLYPSLATLRSLAGNNGLNIIAGKPSPFLRISSLNFWQRFLYSLPQARDIRNASLMHEQALLLVKYLCKEIARLDYSTAASMFEKPILLGASMENSEIVEEILDSFPPAIWSRNRMGHNIFLLAVTNRKENVFNLLYQMSEHKQVASQLRDVKGNNILHLAGKLEPQDQLNRVSGAALQMQRELQWYKEVQKYVLPDSRDSKNSDGRTPAVEFSTEHRDLIKDGERWMKDCKFLHSCCSSHCHGSFCSFHYCTRWKQQR